MIYGAKFFSRLLNINKLFVFNLTRILDLSGFLQEFYMEHVVHPEGHVTILTMVS
jgi:hypothetical protein